MLVTQVGAAAVEQLLCIFDAGLRARQLEVKALKLVGLASGLVGPALIHLLKTGELAPHLGPLHFDTFNLTLKILELSSLVVVLVTLGHSLFSQASSLEILLIEHALRAGQLVIQVQVLLGPTHIKKSDVRIWYEMRGELVISALRAVIHFEQLKAI